MSIKNRFDFKSLLVRASTWLALLATSATSALAAYALTPERAQNLVPDWVLQGCAATAILSAALVPVATSFKQRSLGRATQVIVTTETKVEGDVTPEDATRIAEAAQPNGEQSA